MPAWIHDRAEHLLAKNPSMKKSTAFAVATQQSHATGKTPKDYGTREGKSEAKSKYDKPKKEYKKTPNPKNLDSPKLSSVSFRAFVDELLKEGFAVSQYSGPLSMGKFRMHSQIPPFVAPPLKTAGPPSEKKASATTPAGRLKSSQQVGTIKMTTSSGPSISQVSKPKGFGKPLPGTTNTSF